MREYHRRAGIVGAEIAQVLEPTGSDVEQRQEHQGDSPVLVRMLDGAPEAVRWLWPGRLARGKRTLLAGDPSTGKSFLTTDLVARVTTGGDWPAGEGRAEAGSVVLLTAEDGLADTVRPRLDAHGADVSRVVALTAVKREDGEHHFTLADDLPALEAAILETGAVLVIIDPIAAYLGIEHDSYKDTEVRSVLAPLAALAERTGVAVLAVMHLNKNEGAKALYRVLGSVSFTAAVRAGLAVVPDPEDGERRVLVSLKSNNGRASAALAFRIGGEPACLMWARGAGDLVVALARRRRVSRGARRVSRRVSNGAR